MKCPNCDIPMTPFGFALAPSKTHYCFSPGNSDGTIINCWKCLSCGYSDDSDNQNTTSDGSSEKGP